MPKVLVSSSIGVPQVTLGAVKYLAGRAGDTVSPAPYFMQPKDDGKSVAVIGSSSPLVRAWVVHFNQTTQCVDNEGKPLSGDIPDEYTVTLSHDTTGRELRNMLVSYVDALEGDYKRLDERNDGNLLRLVDVPEGVRYIITEDPELGVESVQEVSRMWNPYHDEDYRFLVWVKKCCRKDASDERKFTRQLKLYHGYGLAIEGDYGMAINYAHTPNATKKVLLLKKNTYYCATPEHPKCCYEIVNENSNSVVNFGPFINADAFSAYSQLYYRLLAKDLTEEAKREIF